MKYNLNFYLLKTRLKKHFSDFLQHNFRHFLEYSDFAGHIFAALYANQ